MRRPFGFLLFLSIPAFTQPAFEVATIKPSGPRSKTIGIYTHPGGRITGENLTIHKLLEEAFGVQDFQIAGGPGWMREERYDLVAQPPASSRSASSKPVSIKLPPNDEQREMLRVLLLERCQLKFHREEREGSVYFLSKNGKDLKLKPAGDAQQFPWVGSNQGGALAGDGIAGTNITMPLLATRLGRYMRRPVVDRTGIEGAYDFKYEYSSGDAQTDLIGSIVTSLQAIGLKIETGKGPIETIVIDRAERPTEN